MLLGPKVSLKPNVYRPSRQMALAGGDQGPTLSSTAQLPASKDALNRLFEFAGVEPPEVTPRTFSAHIVSWRSRTIFNASVSPLRVRQASFIQRWTNLSTIISILLLPVDFPTNKSISIWGPNGPGPHPPLLLCRRRCGCLRACCSCVWHRPRNR